MFSVVAASLSGVANLCLAGVFAALWWADRDTRFNLRWAGGFAAIGIAGTAITAYRANGSFVLLVVTVLATGAAAALLFGGTRLYLGRAWSGRQLVASIVAAWSVLGLAGLHGFELQTLAGSVLIAAVFGWMGFSFLSHSVFERVTGILFLARSALICTFPFLTPDWLAPFFIATHFLVLATGLALLLAAFMRTRERLRAEEREREERTARLDALYRETPALLVVLGADRLVTAVSNDWLRFTGYAREELMGQDALRFVAPAMRQRITGDVAQHLEYDTRIENFEHEVIRKDGSIANVRTAMRAHRNPVTGRNEVIAVSVDQSARRLAEQSARRSAHLLERIVNMLPAAVTVKDASLRLTLWNDHASRLFNRPADQVLGRRLSEASSNPTAAEAEAADRRVLAGARPRARQVPVEIDGHTRWIMVEKAPLLSPEGVVEGVISAAIDITELKEAQAELQQSREYLVQAQQIGRIGYIRSDYRAGRIYWSDTMFDLRGLPRREFFSLDEGMAFVHPDDLPAYIAARDAGIAGKRSFQVEVRVLRPDEKLQWEQAIGHPQFDETGECIGLLLVVQVTTERKLAEIALRTSEARFAGAFHGSTDMMAIARAEDDVFIEVNDAWLQGSGYGRDEVIGRSAAQLDTWVDAAQRAEVYRRVATEGVIPIVVANMRRKDGVIREVRMSGTRIGAGGDTYYFWVGRDVTVEREAARRIAALNAENETALRQIRNIADNLPVLIAHADRDRRFRFVNRTGERWFARPASELVGKSLVEVMGQDWVQGSGDVIAEVLAGRPMTIERRIAYPDGQQRDVEIVYVPDIEADGAVGGYYSLVSDITARKQVEAQLRTSEARFAGAFHGSTDMMALMTVADGRYVEVNEAWLATAGLDREAVVGHTAGELGFWADEEERRRVVALRESGQPIRNLEMKMRRGSEIRHVRISGSRIAAGAADYYFWVGRDVTEEQEVQRRIAALNAANEVALRQIRDITDNLPVTISHSDRDGRCRFINRTGELWFARPASALIGERLADLLGPAHAAKAGDAIASALDGKPARLDTRLRFPDGKERDLELAYYPDVDPGGVVNGYYTMATDMTERRATEEQLRHAQRMEAIGKLTGGVAHDFNNLLGVISGNLELADEMIAGDGELRDMIRTAIRATERGATLTRSLLAYSRQQPLSPTVIDPAALIREMAEMLRRTVPRNIEIEVVSAGGLWRCEADAGQLQNALLNLVVNARDAMPQGGRLTIESANVRLDDDYAATHAEVAPGQYVMLAVSDTGTGMPPEVAARAFDPFFTTKGIGKGTGLGLSMVYGFAKQSRGHVKIYSEIGQGTTVRLYLPRALEAEGPAAAPSEIAGARGETILLVEDSDEIRTLTYALLRSFGYEVLVAAEAKQALRLLEAHPETALLLTDVVLPGELNGERLAARAVALRPHLRVLYMSGYTENAILHHGRLDHGVQLLQKPFRKRDLAAKVRATLDAPREGP